MCLGKQNKVGSFAENSVCIGSGNFADDDGELSKTTCVLIGNGNESHCTGGIAFGRNNVVSADDAVAIGKGNQSSGSASIALGENNVCAQPGALAHSSNGTNCEGFVALDLDGVGSADSVNLQTRDDTELVLDDSKSYSIRVRALGSGVGAQAVGHEVRELLAYTTGGSLTIDPTPGQVVVAKAGKFYTDDWSLTISAEAGRTLRVTCDPGDDNVKFMARVEYSALPGE